MQKNTLDVDYGEFMTSLYDLLAVWDSLLHGLTAPAM
jgi:hypothetical protein